MRKYHRQLPLFWLNNALILGQILIWLLSRSFWQFQYSNGVIWVVLIHVLVNDLQPLEQETPLSIKRQAWQHLQKALHENASNISQAAERASVHFFEETAKKPVRR